MTDAVLLHKSPEDKAFEKFARWKLPEHIRGDKAFIAMVRVFYTQGWMDCEDYQDEQDSIGEAEDRG